jgi:hypothetical protein
MELTADTLIQARYSGALDEMSVYVNLVIQAGAILVGGIVLWRMSAVIHRKKKAERERNSYFSTPYSEGWRRK